MATYTLTGSGVQALSTGTAALHVTISTPATAQGNGSANPPDAYGCGYLRAGDGTGYWEPYAIAGGPQWFPMPRGATSLGYAILPGGTVSVVEVFGSSPLAFPLASLPDVALSSLADAQVLTYQASSSSWINATPTGGTGGAGTGNPDSILLDWHATTDLAGVSLPTATWTDTFAAQSFTVPSTSGITEIAVSGCIRLGGCNSIQSVSSRLSIDSGGTILPLGMGRFSAVGDRINSLQGAGPAPAASLSAGAHTIKIQGYIDGGSPNDIYCRASSLPNVEFLYIRVWYRG